MCRLVGVEMVVRTDFPDFAFGHINYIRLPEHQYDENVVLVPVFHAGALGHFVGVEGFQFLPGF